MKEGDGRIMEEREGMVEENRSNRGRWKGDGGKRTGVKEGDGRVMEEREEMVEKNRRESGR